MEKAYWNVSNGGAALLSLDGRQGKVANGRFVEFRFIESAFSGVTALDKGD